MVEAIRSKVAEICEPLGHKVYAIVPEAFTARENHPVAGCHRV
jgi:hypothetical protein